MKSKDELIETILDLAVKHFEEQIKPDAHATTVAFLLASHAAKEYSVEASDAAAFVAGTEHVLIQLEHLGYAAQVADASAKMNDARKNYENKLNAHPTLIIPDLEGSKLTCEEVLTSIKPKFEILSARKLYFTKYNDTKSDNYRQALMAATSTYTHAYANARSAYLNAAGIAARVPEGSSRTKAFKQALKDRLERDIKYEVIPASFFIRMLWTDILKAILVALLITTVITLPLGISAFFVSAVAQTLLTLGLNSMVLTSVGGSTAATGSGLMACRFFTRKQWEDDNLKTEQCIVEFNQVS